MHVTALLPSLPGMLVLCLHNGSRIDMFTIQRRMRQKSNQNGQAGGTHVVGRYGNHRHRYTMTIHSPIETRSMVCAGNTKALRIYELTATPIEHGGFHSRRLLTRRSVGARGMGNAGAVNSAAALQQSRQGTWGWQLGWGQAAIACCTRSAPGGYGVVHAAPVLAMGTPRTPRYGRRQLWGRVGWHRLGPGYGAGMAAQRQQAMATIE